MKTLLIFLLLAGPVYAADITPTHHAPPTGPIWWAQPVVPQPIIYPTPLRNFFFGTQRLVPTGPPIPYRWEPGRWVPLQEPLK
jgi:hypothetical protein